MGTKKILFAALALLALALPALAGEERHALLGIALDVPQRYGAVPVPPTEPLVVLRYAREVEGKRTRTLRALLEVVRIEWKADPDPCPEPKPITNFERYLDQVLEHWRLDVRKPLQGPEGWKGEEVRMSPGLGSSSRQRAIAYVLSNDAGTWILFGTCEAEDFDKEERLWRKTAQSLEFFAPVEPKDAVKWRRHYEKNPAFRNPELRLRIRGRMVDGWEADDTENFLLLSSSKKEVFVDLLARRLEGIRRAYVERFPPAGEITAVSTVRICKDQDEYHRYGGPEGTAGYWSTADEELVLFVFDMGGARREAAKEDSLSVLYHEAFHQYVHYAAGELAPHSWFGEGCGDYFGGANFTQQGTLGRIEVHPWRIEWIQDAIITRRHPSWREIVWMSQPDFYGPNRSVHYAMAWSMIYFLNECKKVKKEPTWVRILPTYFDTLKAAHAREQARLEAAGLTGDEEEVEKARKAARDEASNTAFQDVDLEEIEAAWCEFTLELKPPK